MVGRHISLASFAVLIALGSWGCAVEVGPVEEAEAGDDLGVLAEPILNGATTTDFVAVGRLNISASNGLSSHDCTATLISSRVILTAAHCFSFNRGLSGLGNLVNPPINAPTSFNAFFHMHNPSPPSGQAASQMFGLRRVFVLGQQYGATDIAVAELDSDVSAAYATPYSVALNIPAQGAIVTGVGFGCTVTGGSASTSKRHKTGAWQAVNHHTFPAMGCKGDSGGPILDSSRKIVALFSAAGPGGITDLNARPVTHRAVIDRINAIYGTRQLCQTCPVIALRTTNNRYLHAPGGGSSGAVINAGATAVTTTERFRLVQLAQQAPAPVPSWVALQTASGRWVGAAPNTSGQVKTTRDRIFDNEMFLMENRGSGKWSLKTNSVTRYFITAENGGGGTVSTNRTTFSANETFAFPFP